jgi:glycosyltransferase involved in cell wall biosynthesis
MKRVLIVSPHYPPINAADAHRVRMSLPYFRQFGWTPFVLTVDPRHVPGVREPLLEATLPPDVFVHRTRAVSLSWTRPLGLGSLAVRSWPFLLSAGSRLIRQHGIDLVYFSTTEFLTLPLGRIWKRLHGVPFVVDVQDLWKADPGTAPVHTGRKHDLMRRVHGVMEPWTFAKVDGVVAVSEDYISTLSSRYAGVAGRPHDVLPFGVSEEDFRLLRSEPRTNAFFRPGDGSIHGVYVGRGGADMANALRVAFGAFARGLRERPDLFKRVRLHFVGTSYAAGNRAAKSVESIAAEAGVAGQVEEHTERIPYFDALQLLVDSDFLVVPGSDDAMYSPSKLYPYMLAGRPLIAAFRRGSPATEIIRRTRAGAAVEFDVADLSPAIERFHHEWTLLLDRPPTAPTLDRDVFAQYGAGEMTRRQCDLFDRVVAAQALRQSASAGASAVTRGGVTCP